MPNLVSNLIVSLVDKVTGPARSASDALRGIGEQARGSAGAATAFHDNAARAAQNHAMSAERAKMQIIAAAAAITAAYMAIDSFVQAASQMEQAEFAIARRSKLTAEEIGKIRESAHATSLAVLQDDIAIMKSIEHMITIAKLTPQAAMDAQTAMGQLSTAYVVDLKVTTAAAEAAINKMKIPVQQHSQLFSEWVAMSKAGAAGAADEITAAFPRLTSVAQRMNYEGMQAAREAVATWESMRMAMPADSATTGMEEMFGFGQRQRARYKAAVKGTALAVKPDLETMQKGWIKAGKNPFAETVQYLGWIQKNYPDVYKKMFTPAGAAAATAAIKNYGESVKELGVASSATGDELKEVYSEYESTIEGMVKAVRFRRNQIRDLLGDALKADWMTINTGVKEYLDLLLKWIKANPDLAATLVEATAGVTLFAGALAALNFIGVGFLPLVGALLLLGGAIKFIKDNWTGIKGFTEEFQKAFVGSVKPEDANMMQPYVTAITDLKNLVTGNWNLGDDKWKAWGTLMGGEVYKAVRNVAAAINAIADALDRLRGPLPVPKPLQSKAEFDAETDKLMADVTSPALQQIYRKRRDDQWERDKPSRIEPPLPKDYPLTNAEMRNWRTDKFTKDFGKVYPEAGLSLDVVSALGRSIGAGIASMYGALVKGGYDDKKGFTPPDVPELPPLNYPTLPPPLEISTPGVTPITTAQKEALGLQVDEINTTKKKADEAKAAINALGETVTPSVNSTELQSLLDLVAAIDRGLQSIGRRASTVAAESAGAMVGAGMGAFMAGGGVRQVINAENSDYSVQ